MQDTITNYLKEKYRPTAIILHGSRARKMEREHSDWDFIFLYKSSSQTHNGREVYEDQNIEFSSHVVPVENIEEEFSIKLQEAKVLYEEDSEATDLLLKANNFYQQGVYWTKEKLDSHKLWLQGRIDGLQDSVNNSLLFTKYFSDLYQRIFNYWYWILQHSHSKPVYIAVEEIMEKDPEYYELVNRLVSSESSMIEKVVAAEKIRDHLFR